MLLIPGKYTGLESRTEQLIHVLAGGIVSWEAMCSCLRQLELVEPHLKYVF
jgi:hypothetical protein